MIRSANRRWLAVLVAAIAVLVLGAGLASHEGRWRAEVMVQKAAGRLPDVGWADLIWMLRPGSGVYLEGLLERPNPFEVIEPSKRSPADVQAGRLLFSRNCSACHGDEARGGAGGPSLHDHTFRQGRRPWALYRTIRFGIPGTAMIGRSLPREEVWKLVTYLDTTLIADARGAGPSAAKAPAVAFEPVTAAELLTADEHPSEWLTYSGSYNGQRHSKLKQIDRSTVGRLRVEWERQLPEAPGGVETSAIVRGTTMFVTEPPNRVLALDAATGRVLWTFSHELPRRLLLCCGPGNRGVAVFGDEVFVGTLDAHLIALEARTGKLIWDVTVADHARGYSITAAPLAVEGMVITGVGGGEFAVRGFVDAYDAATGRRRWRFYTTPAPGEPGAETWEGNSAATGGAPTWLTGSYDPQLRLLYWGVGNPSPNYLGDHRKGDNLYANSVVALDIDSGKLRWHFQFTPHDLHDWDAAQIPVLVNLGSGAQARKVLAWPNRNGFYYLLDRVTGEFLSATPFVKQTWAAGFDAKGRPRVRPDSIPTREGAVVYPSVYGATNWWSPSYDPESQTLLVNSLERGSVYYASPDRPTSPEGFILGSWGTGVPDEDLTIAILALEVGTGRVRWRYARPPRPADAPTGGLLSTAGGLVFGGDGESFFALDTRTGEELWHFAAGGRIVAAPVTYEVVDRQYVVVAAGHDLVAFALGP